MNTAGSRAESIWIVIVNYRTPSLAIDCLRSLASQIEQLCGGHVIVTDNASGDGSVEKLEAAIALEGWSSWAVVMSLPHNGGFAYGNNAGIRAALTAAEPAGYVMLLNPDTVVRSGAIGSLRNFVSRDHRIGIVGSLLENADGEVDCSAHQWHSPLSELEGSARLGLLSRLLKEHRVSEPARPEAHSCDWVSGAAMLIRREVLDQIGLMDEGFFLYFEEVDMCWRAKHAGWEVWYLPAARVLHLEGASTGIRIASKRRPQYWYDSRRRFFVLHYGIAGLLGADLFWALGRLSFLLRRMLHLGGQHGPDPKLFMFDLLWGDLRAIISGELSTINSGQLESGCARRGAA